MCIVTVQPLQRAIRVINGFLETSTFKWDGWIAFLVSKTQKEHKEWNCWKEWNLTRDIINHRDH